MPAGIDPSDRKLLLIAGAVFLAMLSGFFLVPPERGRDAGFPSSYSSAPGGARAAYLLLEELHYRVRRWEQPSSELPEEAQGVVLILADPQMAPGEPEKQALEKFVERGGQVVFTGARLESFFKGTKLEFEMFPGEVREFPAKMPSRYSRTAPKIALRPQARWKKLEAGQAGLYGESGGNVAVIWRQGEGQIVWWAGSTPLTNAGITRAGNLNLFLETIQEAATEKGPPLVYWDEYFHGQRNSLWAFVRKTPLPLGMLQIGLLALAVVFTFSRRSGPVVKPAVVSRLSPLEFVDTLGGLYRRAGAAPAAVGVAYQKFRGLLTRQLRLPATIADQLLAQAAGQRLGQKTEELAEILQRAETASRAAKLAPASALALIRELEGLEHKIGLRKRTTQEKF